MGTDPAEACRRFAERARATQVMLDEMGWGSPPGVTMEMLAVVFDEGVQVGMRWQRAQHVLVEETGDDLAPAVNPYRHESHDA